MLRSNLRRMAVQGFRAFSHTPSPRAAPSDEIVFFLNGERFSVPSHEIKATDSLLTFLRDRRGLTGTKAVCNEGGCGACTVVMSEWDPVANAPKHKTITSCLVSLPFVANTSILTSEGLASAGNPSSSSSLHPLQSALLEGNASQCGYCTPGVTMALAGESLRNPDATAREIERALDGNLCRCTGYRPIVDAGARFAVDGQDPEFRADVLDRAEAINAAFPSELRAPWEPLIFSGLDCTWYRPVDLDALLRLMSGGDTSLVAGSHSFEWQGASAPQMKRMIGGFTDVGYTLHQHPEQAAATRAFISTSGVKELKDIDWGATVDGRKGVWLGAAVSIGGMAEAISERIATDPSLSRSSHESYSLRSLARQTRFFANTQVRSSGTIGGSLVNCSHVSDLVPAMTALNASLEIVALHESGEGMVSRTIPMSEFIQGDQAVDLGPSEVLRRVFVPYSRENEYSMVFKFGNKRRVDTISALNGAARVKLSVPASPGEAPVVEDVALVLGALGTPGMRIKELESWLVGQKWDADIHARAADVLEAALPALISGSRHPSQEARMYQAHLVRTMWLRVFAYVSTKLGVSSPLISSAMWSLYSSTGSAKWVESVFGNSKVGIHSGLQNHAFNVAALEGTSPVSTPDGSDGLVFEAMPHVFAREQVTGEARYTADLGLPPSGLWASLVRSPVGHGIIKGIDTSAASAIPGFRGFFGAQDVPGTNAVPVFRTYDEEVFASKEVLYNGQPVGVVVAKTREEAEAGARAVKVEVEVLPSVDSVEEATEYFSTLPIYSYKSGGARDADLEFSETEMTPTRTVVRGDVDEALERSANVVSRKMDLGNGQYHMYLETHNCLVLPQGGAQTNTQASSVMVHSSTQSPTNVVDTVSRALGLGQKDVTCRVERIGGGFGGKQTRGGLIAAAAAVPALALNRPVKLVLSREEDMSFCPGRSPLHASYSVGWEKDPNSSSGIRLTGMDVDMTLNGGATQDYSVDVLETAIFVLDGAYRVPHDLRVRGRCAKTNRGSYTATRGFGKPQAAALIESIVDDVARDAGVDPNLLRDDLLFAQGDKTLTSTPIGDDVLRMAWDGVAKGASAFPGSASEPEEPATGTGIRALPHRDASYAELREHCDAFNAHPEHRYIKRGVAMVASKGNMGFLDSPDINRGLAMVSILKDGSINITQSGVEMGQGLFTRMAAVASDAFGVPLSKVRISETNTFALPNTPPTTMVSTDMAGNAILDAARELIKRLAPVREKVGSDAGWDELISAAYLEGIPMTAMGMDAYPMLAYDWEQQSGQISYFFVWGAALSVVELDAITGTFRTLRQNVVQDCGQRSINPALDVGQVEGGVSFGMGQYLLEDMVWDTSSPDGSHALYTNNVARYKPCTVDDIPLDWNIRLLRYNQDPVSGLHGTKGIGEACNQHALSVYFAIKDAMASVRGGEGGGAFSLGFPATPQSIRWGIGNQEPVALPVAKIL